MREIKYYYIRESAIQSIISDTTTFGIFILLMFLNYQFWGGRWYTTLFILIIWLAFIISKTLPNRKEFHTNQELIDYLKKQNE